MRKYLLLAGAALIGLGGSAYAALDCNTPPTCDELGYAYPSHWCENQAVLKCPFDQTKVFCGKPKDPDAPITCEVGSILFNDFKCYDKAPTDLSKVLGVVFDPVKRLAIIWGGGANNIPWSKTETDISTLTNCVNSNFATCSTDGKDNTQKIVAALGESSDYAAGFCYTLTHGGLDKGSWFLPSASELKTLYDNKTEVNAGLTYLGSSPLPAGGYWSSNENTSRSKMILYVYPDGTSIINTMNNSAIAANYYARCAVAY